MKTWCYSVSKLASSIDLPDAKRNELVMRATLADLAEDRMEDFRRLEPSDVQAYHAFLKLIELPPPSDPNFSYEEVSDIDADASCYCTGLLAAAEIRRPFKSDIGHLGIGPEVAKAGDVVCIFHGAPVPFVMQPQADGKYCLLGEAYMDGIIDGEFLQSPKQVEKFVLS